MTIEVRIDAPGAGAWIMERAHGYFRDGIDHSFSSHDTVGGDDRTLGGIAMVGYVGASMTTHMAGADKRWFSRKLAVLAFGYAFDQLRCKKLLAPVSSANTVALALNIRGGWRIEAVIRDALPDADMVVLSMTRDTCPWLQGVPDVFR